MIKSGERHLSESFVDSHLSRLEELVDVDHVIRAEQKQLDVFNFQPVKILPVLITMRDDVAHCSAGHGEWPSFTFDQMWNDYSAMLLNELQPVYEKALKNRVVLLWDCEISADKFRKMNLGVITKIVVPTIEQAHEKIDEFRI